MLALSPVTRLLQRVVRSADHAVGSGYAVGAGVDRSAGAVVEDRRRAEDVALHQPLDTVDHPGQIANAGNDFRVGEQLRDRRHPGTPGSIGVENDFGGAVRVVVVEEAIQNAFPLVVIDEYRVLVASAHLAEQGAEQPGQWPRHPGVESWVLS